jgi:urease accessory protein
MHQKSAHVWIAVLVSLVLCEPSYAHGFGGTGWLHPLTGLDHMLAMVAVGAWSAQLGGRAVYGVPLAFLGAMAIGATLGIVQGGLAGTEFGIALSVLLLGIAIALERRTALWIAAIGVGLFGVCHGYAHGSEMPGSEHVGSYAAGFLITTAGLHLVGAVGALLLLESKWGKRWLGLGGMAIAVVGAYLILVGPILDG